MSTEPAAAHAVGILFEPTRIKRKARAEVDAELMKAVVGIQISEMQRRVLEGLMVREVRRQENIESITAQAARALPNDAKVEALEEDWVAHFFKQCDTVSDKQMQSLWARLLAGEATCPGTFSKRTVGFVSTFDRKDAELFTNFCQFVWLIDGPTPLIYGYTQEIYAKQGISYQSLAHLGEIGLVSHSGSRAYTCSMHVSDVCVDYFDKRVFIKFRPDTGNTVSTGEAVLTSIGRELAPICGAAPNMEFFDFVVQKWISQGHKVIW